MTSAEINELNTRLADTPAAEVLNYYYRLYGDTLAFATSLGVEDQALTHILATSNIPVKIFTLDTGCLFAETYQLLELTKQRYGLDIQEFLPDEAQVNEMIESKGIRLFYDSIENRKLCCHIRKVEPLKRALQGMQAWITGMRREQSAERKQINVVECDEENGMLKINPLYKWTEQQLWQYIHENNVPYNPLHDKGFKSIGCLPCTRALEPGEDARAGRWWWEQSTYKECGLHEK